MAYDTVNYWSEIKLEIVRDYASAYSTILSRRPRLYHMYIDAFAGAGVHISRATNTFIPGSPLNALLVSPPFKEFHFIDIEGEKVESLRGLVGHQPQVHIYNGDCNQILLSDVFPKVQYRDYRRALCLLDPYGLHLNWQVIHQAGQMKTIDMFLNFPTMDMNRNVLWSNPDVVGEAQVARMTRFWGDDSWRAVAYSTRNLFDMEMKSPNAAREVVGAFRQRLKTVAGFENVPDPLPMRNSAGAIVYYLFFASPKAVAGKIVRDIFSKHRSRGGT